MRKITAIQAQKKDSKRVNIYLDGEFAFGLARITAAWLQTGQTLDDEKIAKLQAEDSRERALQQAYLFLSYRARSEDEIRKNLRKHEYPEAVIEETLERLQRDGFANDKEFARAWIENRNTFRPRGRRALAMELRQKGIDDETIRSTLEGLDEETLAYEAGLKKASRLRGLEWGDFRKKLGDFLSRRGFSYSVTTSTVKHLWDEMNEAGEQHTIDNEEIA